MDIQKKIKDDRTQIINHNDQIMSSREFAHWLADDILYTRNCEGNNGYAVYAGDGTFLDVVEDLEEVWASCSKHDMMLATIH